MRAFLISSLGVACAAALVTPTALPAGAQVLPSRQERVAGPGGLAGTTRSLPLVPLAQDRAVNGGQPVGLTARRVAPFSLLGVVWDDAAEEPPGRVLVRTRSVGGAWSAWQELSTHRHDGPDPGPTEGSTPRGSTTPLWVGPSDAVEVRVQPAGPRAGQPRVPRGMRVDLVDPGHGTRVDPGRAPEYPPAQDHLLPRPADDSWLPEGWTPDDLLLDDVGEPDAAPGEPAAPPEGGEPGGPTAPDPDVDPADEPQPSDLDTTTEAPPDATPDAAHAAARPRIVSRAGWGADERLREREFLYTKSVRVAFVHHSATGNNYTCKQAPSMIRSIYRYHVKSSGWRDIGYNFLIDKCGTIYEGRAGGVTKPVMGAHTLGFNHNSTGIAVLGTHSTVRPSKAVVTSLARLTGWKLGLTGRNPKGKVRMISGGGKYRKGTKVTMNTVSGHRDGFTTDCPGDRLYAKLPSVRSKAAKYQKR